MTDKTKKESDVEAKIELLQYYRNPSYYKEEKIDVKRMGLNSHS